VGKKTPEPPDYRGAAEEQAQSSREVTNMQTWANRPTQNTPWGTSEWTTKGVWDPAAQQRVNQWTQNITLDPREQQALDDQMRLKAQRSGLAGGMYERVAQEFDPIMQWDQFQEMGGVPMTPEQEALQRSLSTEGLTNLDPSQRYSQRAEDAIYGQFERRNEPRFEQERAATDTQLRNQGLRPGDEAYDYAMSQLDQQQNDARLGAQYQATIGSGAEAQRMLGMDAETRQQMCGERGQQGQFANQAAGQAFGMAGTGFGQEMQQSNMQTQVRQQQIAEEMQKRGFSLNEINAILTGQQVNMPNMPDFKNATKSETAQYNQAAQNQFQADMDVFGATPAQRQMMMDAATGLAGGFMSDVRLKKNLEYLYQTPAGFAIYQWDWNDKAIALGVDYMPTIGVIAQEVMQFVPEAVHLVKEFGYYCVDYEKISEIEGALA
jgi:hypothetical protein